MPSRLPLVVVHRRVVPEGFEQSPEYHEHRAAIERATTYRQVVEYLERAVRAGSQAPAADLAPAVAWARRFLNTTGLYRSRPIGTDQRRLAERAVRALVALLVGEAEKPGPKRRSPLSPVQATLITKTRQVWNAILKDAWPRDDHLAVLEAEARRQFYHWPAAYHRALRRILARPRVRPSDVAIQLTAWQLGLSVRQVRRPNVPESRYA